MGDQPAKKREKIGKRQNAKTRPHLAFSQSLREARQLIASNNPAAGLAALNTLAAATRNPARRAKILLTIAESETRLSRHTEALAAFQKASQLAAQAADTDLTLLAGTGIVRSLLRSLRTEEAKTAAAALLADLAAAETAFAQIQNLTPEQLAAKGQITVPARPPRSTVGLTKIANAFIQSGLTEEAREFLLKAIQASPNGASRARQSLAKIALASDEPELAERYAREALLMGRFQAKTTAAWPLYLDARARQNKAPILEPDVLAAYRQHAKGRLAAASGLSIVRVLRAHGDPAWKDLATGLVSRKADPVITTEIEKLLHADAKLFATEEPRKIAARALRLLRTADVSAQETIAHAKEYVRFSLLAGTEPNLDTVVRTAARKFPAPALLAIRHAACLGAMMATKHDIARPWLLALINEAARLGQAAAWGRANWALARMESLLENNAEAAFYYMEVAAHPTTPPRFKIQAMLRGLKFLGKSGDNSTDIAQLSENIRDILRETHDFRILLDAARQLALAGSNFTGLTGEAAQMGIKQARQDAKIAATPQEKLGIHEYLSRKLHCDLVGQNEEVVTIWNSHSDLEKSEFAATGGATWYEYVRTVFLSQIALGMTAQAEKLASDIIDTNRATPEGYVIIGSTYAEWLIQNGEEDKAFEFFNWISKESPTHRKAAAAHYWLSVRNYLNKNLNGAAERSKSVSLCFGNHPELLEEWKLSAKSLIILSKVDRTLAPEVATGLFSTNFLAEQEEQFLKDLDTLDKL
jgi:tetratricopeptide (TPR) repeat protein